MRFLMPCCPPATAQPPRMTPHPNLRRSRSVANGWVSVVLSLHGDAQRDEIGVSRAARLSRPSDRIGRYRCICDERIEKHGDEFQAHIQSKRALDHAAPDARSGTLRNHAHRHENDEPGGRHRQAPGEQGI